MLSSQVRCRAAHGPHCTQTVVRVTVPRDISATFSEQSLYFLLATRREDKKKTTNNTFLHWTAAACTHRPTNVYNIMHPCSVYRYLILLYLCCSGYTLRNNIINRSRVVVAARPYDTIIYYIIGSRTIRFVAPFVMRLMMARVLFAAAAVVVYRRLSRI